MYRTKFRKTIAGKLRMCKLPLSSTRVFQLTMRLEIDEGRSRAQKCMRKINYYIAESVVSSKNTIIINNNNNNNNNIILISII